MTGTQPSQLPFLALLFSVQADLRTALAAYFKVGAAGGKMPERFDQLMQALDEDQPGPAVDWAKIFEEDREFNQGTQLRVCLFPGVPVVSCIKGNQERTSIFPCLPSARARGPAHGRQRGRIPTPPAHCTPPCA